MKFTKNVKNRGGGFIVFRFWKLSQRGDKLNEGEKGSSHGFPFLVSYDYKEEEIMTERVFRRQDYIIDGIDYYDNDRDREKIERIINSGGKVFLSESPDAVSVRKWISKKCAATKILWVVDLLSALHALIVHEGILELPIKTTLWDKQTYEQRKLRIKRNKKALEVLIKEVLGQTNNESDEDKRGNELYKFCDFKTVCEENNGVIPPPWEGDGLSLFEVVEKKENDILKFLTCMYGVVIKKGEDIKKRRFLKVSLTNREKFEAANRIYNGFFNVFNTVYDVVPVIESCLRLIYPESSADITYSKVSDWITRSQIKYYKNKSKK